MNKFFSNLARYREYAFRAAVASLKSEVEGSVLNWLWWILDPFLFMMVYSFVSIIVFGKSEPHFIAFVFVGYATWSFINRTLTTGVKLVRSSKGVISRIYVPKYILLFTCIFKHGIQFFITLGLTLIVAIIDKVHFSWRIVYVPVIIVIMVILTFGVSCVFMHIGVYAKDFSNLVSIFLKLVFYMSGVFYNVVNRVPDPYNTVLISLNPAALLINEMRNVLLYEKNPNLILLGVWLVIGILISALGIHLIHKNEQNYVKAI